MTSEEWSVDLKKLEDFLTELEKLCLTQGYQHFCVLPATVMPPSPVSRYAWPTSAKATEVTESISTGSRMYVAARNITLHRYVVKFRVTSESSQVRLQRSPDSAPGSAFSGELILDRKPPIRSSGTPVCKGCGLTVGLTFDLTVVLRCEFEVVHEGSTASKETRNIVVTPHQ